MNYKTKRVLAVLVFFLVCAVGGAIYGIVHYANKGRSCPFEMQKCSLVEDLLPSLYGYSYTLSCDGTDIYRADRTAYWGFEMRHLNQTSDHVLFEKTGMTSLVVPKWLFTLNGQNGVIGYGISIVKKYQVSWGDLKWRSKDSYLPTTWPNSMQILDRGGDHVVKFNKKDITIKREYNVCLKRDLDQNRHMLATATIVTFVIGKSE